MTAILIVLGYSLVVVFDMIPMIKKGNRKEIALYTSIIVICFVISILLSIGVNIPSPISYYEKIIMLIM